MTSTSVLQNNRSNFGNKESPAPPLAVFTGRRRGYAGASGNYYLSTSFIRCQVGKSKINIQKGLTKWLLLL